MSDDKEKPMKFGIDFGTSFSTMCALRSDGRPEVLRDGNGDEKIPSVVYWGKDGVKVGRAAVGMLEDAQCMPEEEKHETLGRLVKGVKRNLKPGYSIALPDGKVVTPVDVVAEILSYLKKEAEERHFGETVTEVALTHPATFTEVQKRLLKDAAKKAGFKNIALRSEPEAAALGYASICEKKDRLGGGILVFDFGGGTFDLAYLRREKNGTLHFPVQPVGSSQCGGDDIDQIVYNWAEKKLGKEKGRSFGDGFNSDLIFLAHCCRAKEKLSVNSKASLQEFNTGFSAVLTRDEFNELIMSKLDVAISLVKSMVTDLNHRNLSIDGVLLIGGSTRIPLVVERLKEVLPDVKHIHTTKTDTAVVCGSVCDEKFKTAKRESRLPRKVQRESFIPTKDKDLESQSQDNCHNPSKRSWLESYFIWCGKGEDRNIVLFVFYPLITIFVGKFTLFPSMSFDGHDVIVYIMALGSLLLSLIFVSTGNTGFYCEKGEKALQGWFYRLKRAYLWFGIGNILLWLIGVIIEYMGHVTLLQYVTMAISVLLFCFSIFKLYRFLD